MQLPDNFKVIDKEEVKEKIIQQIAHCVLTNRLPLNYAGVEHLTNKIMEVVYGRVQEENRQKA